MEKLCKAYLMFVIVAALSLFGATPVFAQNATTIQPDPDKAYKVATDIMEKCKLANKNKENVDNICTLDKAYATMSGNGSKGSCSDDGAKVAMEGLSKATDEARKTCGSAVGGSEETSLEVCVQKIKDCAGYQKDVNGLDKEETKSEDHTAALTQYANNSMLQSMGIQLPTQKKLEPLAEEEKLYYDSCPTMGSEQYATELKASEEKRDKLKEDIAKKKKDVIESMAKASKDMDEYNKKKAERSERARKDKAEFEKEIQRINQDHNKQTAELMKAEAETIKQRNNVDADYSALEQMRKKLATDLSGISVELSGVCKGKYHELLQKSLGNSNRRVGSASGAVEARDYKIAFLKRCVRDQWFEVKQKYDKIKAELVTMRQEKDNARKQLAAINNEKSNMIAMKARQDQAVQSGEQDRMTAAAQLEQEMIQGAQRGVQQNQQTAANLQAEISNLEHAESKIERRITELGKKPNGKSSLAEADTAVKLLKDKKDAIERMLTDAEEGGEGNLDASCVKRLTAAVIPAREALKGLTDKEQGERATASEQKKNDAKSQK